MLAAIVLSLLAAGTSAPHHHRPSAPSWVVGEWGGLPKDGKGVPECGEHRLSYYADHTYQELFASGTWQLRGDLLCTTPLVGNVGQPVPRSMKASCSRVAHGDNVEKMRLRSGSTWQTLGRCGPTGRMDPTTKRSIEAALHKQRG